MKSLLRFFNDLKQYPSAIASMVIILILLGISVYTLVTIPYTEAVRLWRGGEDVWYQLPKTVPPAWVNSFSATKLPDTIILNTATNPSLKTGEEPSGDGKRINMEFTFDFPYDEFPQEMSLYLKAKYDEKAPFVSLTWFKPDGSKISLGNFSMQGATQNFRFSQDPKLKNRFGEVQPQEALLAVKGSDPLQVEKGQYKLQVQAITFEKESEINVEFIEYGKVYGIAGTDHMRRNLMVALLWGMPVALSFGLIAALGTSIASMIIAAFGAWFGGWIDELIQRVTEINSVLPFLPILIMVGTFYSRSIFTILAVTILLSIFGLSIKNYRAIFLQVREMPYIEAARAYGASNSRIILNYLVPRIIPLLVPGLVTGIPSYVFLEASLSVLGLGDPVLPTWGKIIQDAEFNGALYQGMYYWVMEPAILLMITGLAFSMLGFALDRIFNPRLRGM